MNNLLLGRNYHVDGTWYAPQKFLESFKSVLFAEYTETTSSAGDWTGYILQKIGKTFYVILFWQTNSYPNSGFDIVTDENYYYAFNGETPTKEEVDELLWSIENF